MMKVIAIERREKQLLAELNKLNQLLQNKNRVYRTKIANKIDLNVNISVIILNKDIEENVLNL